jgi:hypothetical protein
VKRLLTIGLMLTGCETVAGIFPAQDVAHTGNIHTLSFDAADWSERAYQANYLAGAKKACGNESYKILEKSGDPTTLKDIPGLKGSGKYFWVVKCDAAH